MGKKEEVLSLKELACVDLDEKGVKKVIDWVNADWESHDINPDAVRLIHRMASRLNHAQCDHRWVSVDRGQNRCAKCKKEKFY